MKDLSKLAYKLYSMGLEKEAAKIDDLIKESSKKQKVCKNCGAVNDCDAKECKKCGHTKFSACKEIQENDAKDKKPKRDACYYKVKSRFDKWPSAYGSGALVRCRKVGVKNWGEGDKKKKKKSKKKK